VSNANQLEPMAQGGQGRADNAEPKGAAVANAPTTGGLPAGVEERIGKLRWDERGLVPAVVQDAVSKDVLMVAYMSKESLAKSLETGETWFWSRSRGSLWHKGETSGNVQRIQAIRYDCDADTLLVLVEPAGPACHTGKYSCFYQELTAPAESSDTELNAAATSDAKETRQAAVSGHDRFAILSKLESVIAAREAERPEGAYTTYLFDKGVDKILKKVGEEAAEVIIAAKNRSADELRYEASDLLFHLLVLLREQNLPLDEVLAELARRHAAPKKTE